MSIVQLRAFDGAHQLVDAVQVILHGRRLGDDVGIHFQLIIIRLERDAEQGVVFRTDTELLQESVCGVGQYFWCHDGCQRFVGFLKFLIDGRLQPAVLFLLFHQACHLIAQLVLCRSDSRSHSQSLLLVESQQPLFSYRSPREAALTGYFRGPACLALFFEEGFEVIDVVHRSHDSEVSRGR